MAGEERTSGDSRGPDPGRRREPDSQGPRSVLATLRELRGIDRGVMLPDAGSDDAPIVNTQSIGKLRSAEGRYQVLGEIARGGVGIILKGRDVDLGRDVAMKVLRDEHLQDPDLVQRFVEEAQIGGQLQHPGMVPVYELGLRDDGRPFFSMKLVKGRTLGALLADRKDPDDDLRSFLKMFESVCQTVAYAHEHGVAHRDLKPSNVMIGAHEQVRVVDWGLAKVKGQGDDRASARRDELADKRTVIDTVRTGAREGSSLSMAGSIIGTPGYMAPEQARGENEQLDERSDVFALGAILCEILTGKPPYLGTPEEAVDAAANARLADAMARLDAAHADPVLVELAKACMAPARAARPRDAGAVAEEIHRYLVSVEDRERTARETEASADIRSAAERKIRRLTVLTFAVALVTLVVGGGAFAWNRAQENARRETAAHLIDGALHQAVVHRSKATETGDTEAWRAALSSARKALSIAEGPDAEPALLDRSRGLFEQIQAESDHALEVSRQVLHDRDLAKRLGGLREIAVADPGAPIPVAVSAALEGYGVHLGDAAVSSVPKSVRGAPEGVEIARALTAWTRHVADDERLRDVLCAVAETFDPDPWRAALHGAADADALLALAADEGLTERGPADIVDLALALESEGDAARAGDLLLASRLRHPSDFWPALALGAYLRRHEMPPAEVVGIDESVLELGRTFMSGYSESPSWPEEFMPWARASIVSSQNQVRRVYEANGRIERAVPLLRVSPQSATFLVRFENEQLTILVLQWKKDRPGELSGWRDTSAGLGSIPLDGGGTAPLTSFRSLPHLSSAVALRPSSTTARACLALSLLDCGDLPAAEEELAHVGDEDRRRADVVLARSCLASARGDVAVALELAREAREASPKSDRALIRLVAALIRAGAFVEAVELSRNAPEGAFDARDVDFVRRVTAIDLDLERFVAGTRTPVDAAEALHVALVLQLRGHPAEAEALYARHVEITPTPGSDFWNGVYDLALRAASEGVARAEGDERARLAGRALRWLAAILDGWRTATSVGRDMTAVEQELQQPHVRIRAVAALRRLQRDASFDPVRSGDVFDTLPEDLRAALTAAWDSVRAVLQERER